MGYLKTIYLKNGNIKMPYIIFKCDKCGDEIEEYWPRWEKDGKIYCSSCSFKLGIISGDKYLDSGSGLGSNMFKAAINPETKEIEVSFKNSKFSWEKSNKDYRHTEQYQKWRKAVFERDKYTCQDCGQVGGLLNAHHIKTFAKYKKLRFDIDNGITLCKHCHSKRHKKKVVS